MDVGLLYSGGKDSSLAALLLEPFCTVTLLCCTFGVTDDFEHAARAGRALDFPVRRIDLDPAVADEATARIVADGCPRNGIQQVHEHALERCAALDFAAVGDGTRRDDRAPTVERPFAQSLEDRHGIAYLAPLAGFGRAAVDVFAATSLTVESGPSAAIERGDYEAELRALVAAAHGPDRVTDLFPEHVQSRVTGRA